MAPKFDPDKDAAWRTSPLQESLGWITIGMNAGSEILVVVWTERDDGERLISVRRDTAKDRKDYEG